MMRFDPEARHPICEYDVPYAKLDGLELLARIVRPEPPLEGRRAPCLIDIHGGAWSHFDRTAGRRHQRALAASGAVVIAVDFRQAPAHTYPAPCQDIQLAVAFASRHARTLGIDLQSIGFIGSSSGGQIALEVALKADAFEPPSAAQIFDFVSERWEPVPAPAPRHSPAFVLALFPVCDPLNRYRYVLSRRHEPPDPTAGFHAAALIAAHLAYFPDEAAMEAASLTRIVGSGEAKAMPPVWLAQPELDQNVPAPLTDAFVAAYRAAGGDIERVVFPDQPHGFIHREGPAGAHCIAQMRAFIARRSESRSGP